MCFLTWRYRKSKNVKSFLFVFICTKCAGPVELLHNGKYGLLVNIYEEDLFRRLEKMILEPQTREQFKNKAIERSQLFNLNHQLKEIEQVFTVDGHVGLAGEVTPDMH